MAEFLSPEWVEDLDVAARAAVSVPPVALVVQQVVRGAPGGDARYHLTFKGGTLRVRGGDADSPDITITCEYDVARAMHAGEVNAQEALAAGGLEVRGDLRRLAREDGLLGALDDVFVGVRTSTTYRGDA